MIVGGTQSKGSHFQQTKVSVETTPSDNDMKNRLKKTENLFN